MKLKQQPEDFQVEERTDVQPGTEGPFAFYQLEKRGLGTPEALQGISRRWKIPFRCISYGGLKDRHAWTTQYITIFRGPRRDLQQEHLQLRYLGQLLQPYTAEQVRGNRFRLVLRDMDEQAVKNSCQALAEVRRNGVANYFDDQRFGSLGPSQQFVARKLIEGDYETALKLALAEPYAFDRAAQKEEKRILREHWGDWATAKAKLPRGHTRSIVTYLVDHPTNFRGAVARLRIDLKSLYLSAYQSYLWNRILARWIEQQCRSEQLVYIQPRLGLFPMWRWLGEPQRQVFHIQRLPLPSARLQLSGDDPLKPLIDTVLQEEGLDLSQLKLKHFREPFFSRGERAAAFVPENLDYRAAPDERHAGKQKLILAFDLPRGCYATMLVKRITL